MYHIARAFSATSPTAPISLPLVFGNWLQAVTDFKECYQQLSQQIASELNNEPSSRFIAQYSTSQMDELRTKMGQQVQALVAELDSPVDLSNLLDHTARLRALTNQAAVILTLRHQSSC